MQNLQKVRTQFCVIIITLYGTDTKIRKIYITSVMYYKVIKEFGLVYL